MRYLTITILVCALTFTLTAPLSSAYQNTSPQNEQSSKQQEKEQKERAKQEERARKERAKQEERERKERAKLELERQKQEARENKQRAKQEKTKREREASIAISVNRNYDRFKDYTLLILNEMPVYNPQLNRALTGTNFTMTAAIGFRGQQATPPFEVALGFNIRTRGYQPVFYTGPELIFIADGERMSATGSTATYQTYVNWYPLLGNVQMVRTYVAATMRYEDFQRIAKSSNVEFSLGGIVAPLQQNHLQALRTLLSEVGDKQDSYNNLPRR